MNSKRDLRAPRAGRVGLLVQGVAISQ